MPSRTAYKISARASTPWTKTMASIKSSVSFSVARAGNALAEIVDGQAQPFFQRDARLPRQVPPSTRIVERNPVDVALATRSMVGFELVVGEDREFPAQLVDAHVFAAADVIGPARTAFERRQVRGCCVADVQHVAGLTTVAIDGDGLARQHAACEDRDHTPLLTHEILPRPVDVRVPENGELEPKSSFEGAEVLLKAELARPIRRQGSDRMVLIGRHHVGLPVQGPARGDEHELPDVVVDAGLQ